MRPDRRFLLVLAVGCLGGCAPDAASPRKEDQEVERLARTWPPYQAPRDPANLFDKGPTPPQIEPSLRNGTPDGDGTIWTVSSYREWDISRTAEDSLARIGANAVPAVAAALRDSNPEQRLRAARILARIGPEAQSAVPELIAALSDSAPEVRKAVARALGQIGPGASAAVVPLLEAIEDSDKAQSD